MVPARVTRLVDHFLAADGKLDAEQRRAALDRAHGGRKATPVAEPLAGWIDKVARHAYRATDEDVEALRAAGYSEDQIYEATVAAALGAGLSRLERAMALVRGGQ